MFKCRFYIICLVLGLIPFLAVAQSDQSICWGVTGQATNLTYESDYGTIWFNGNLSFLLGFRLNQITFNLETDIDYFSYNTSTEAALVLKGGWFDIRSLILTKFQLQPWLDLKLGVGGLWLRSSLNYNETGWIGQSQGGLSCLLNLGFDFPGFFAGIELQNKFDLLFNNQYLVSNKLCDIYYLGGLRFDFRPGTPWMTVFTSFNFLVWNSNTEAFQPNIWTASVNFGLDFTFDGTEEKNPKPNLLIKADNGTTTTKKNTKNTSLPNNTHTTKNIAKNSNTTKNTTDTKDKKAVTPVNKQIDYAAISPSLQQLNAAGPGKAVNFPELEFKEGKTELAGNAQQMLDYIAEIVKVRDNLIVAIAGYTEVFNDPEKEITVASSRAQFIKQYLVSKGIEKSRLKINPVTHFALANSKTRIVISVIDYE